MDETRHPLVEFLTHARDARREVELTLSSGNAVAHGVPGDVWVDGLPAVVMHHDGHQAVVMLAHVAVAAEPVDLPEPDEEEGL